MFLWLEQAKIYIEEMACPFIVNNTPGKKTT